RLTSRLTTAGGSSPPKSCVGALGGTSAGRVTSSARPNSANHTARPPAAIAISTNRAGSTYGRLIAIVKQGLEPDVDVRALAAHGLEVRPRLEAAHAGDYVGRERLHRGVERLDRAVVELPRVGDLVLGVGQFALQPEEVLVGLEVGVRLGEREQPAERL